MEGATSYWKNDMWFTSQFCLNFCTLWEGVCIDLFSIWDYVYRSEFDSRNKHSDYAPTSSVDEIQGVSPLPCRFCTLAHDHGVHDFFNNYSIQNKFIYLIQVNIRICWRHIISKILCLVLREAFLHVVLSLSSLF